MPSLTLAVPEELKKEMDKRPEINWSEIAREAIRQRLLLLKEMDRLLAKSELTEADALELGRKVNEAVAKRYKKMV